MSDQPTPSPAQGGGEDIQLPFEPQTLLVGLWRTRWILVSWVFVSLILGIAGGLVFGTRIYQSQTDLRYRSLKVGERSNDPAAPIRDAVQFTNHNKTILEEVRRRLNMATTIAKLDKALNAGTEEGTNKLTIKAWWDAPDMSANLANTLRDVFLEDQLRTRLRDELSEVEYHEQEALTVVKQSEASIPALEERIKALEEQVEREMKEAPRLADPAAQADAVKAKIETLREQRLAKAELNRMELDLQNQKKLYDLGILAKADYDKAVAVYERQKALSEDSGDLKALTAELARLQEQAAALGGGRAPSANELEKMRDNRIAAVTKLFDAKTVLASVQGERETLEKMLNALSEGLTDEEAGLPAGWREDESEFRVVTDAEAPLLPMTSNRKIVALLITALGCVMGFALLLARELADTTVKSGKELSMRLKVPTLMVLPDLAKGVRTLPTVADRGIIEQFAVMARRVRGAASEPGARILVLSAVHGEGCSTVTTNLAAVFGRQEGRVLIIDAAIRSPVDPHGMSGQQSPPPPPEPAAAPDRGARGGKVPVSAGGHRSGVRDIMPDDSEGDILLEILGLENDVVPQLGLGAYLASDELEFDAVAWPTVLPGVYCVPRLEEDVSPDLLASHRMRQLLVEASARFPIVLLDGPPVLPYADADALTQWVDGVLLVVQSRKCRVAALKQMLQRVGVSRVPVIGAVLNRTGRLYLGLT